MKMVLRIVGGLVAVLVLSGAAAFTWAGSVADARLARPHETHRVDVPVPFPLSREEVEALTQERAQGLDGGAEPLDAQELTAIATQRAQEPPNTCSSRATPAWSATERTWAAG